MPLAAGGAIATTAVVVLATIPPAFATAPAALLNGPTGVSTREHRELAAARAFTSNPIRFLLFGDSVAFTADLGLRVGSVEHYGVSVINAGVLGCDLDPYPSREGGVVYPSLDCGDWPTGWAKAVARIRPEVVGLLIGRFELADHLYDGTWMHLGEPAWDAHLLSELDRAVAVLSADGAHVVIFTFPYINPPLEQPNGAPWPENVPSRVDEWNALLRQVHARTSGHDADRPQSHPRPRRRVHDHDRRHPGTQAERRHPHNGPRWRVAPVPDTA